MRWGRRCTVVLKLHPCDVTQRAVQYRMSSSQRTYEYDLLVIGGGSGGLAAAQKAAGLGAKVGLCDFVQPSPKGTTWGLGGTCVNVGCIPKKLMHQAALLGEARNHSTSFGWPEASGAAADWHTLKDNVTNYIRSLNFNYRMQLRSKDVEYHNRFATFVNANTVEAKGKDDVVQMKAKTILLAPGGRPTGLECSGSELAISSDDIFRLQSDPGNTLVVGASYIGLECAGFLKGIGRNATVMMRSIPLRGMDRDMSERVATYMSTKSGISIIRPSVPVKIERTNNGQKLRVTSKNVETGVESQAEYDTVLAAVGRKPHSNGMNLQTANVEIDRSGFIKVDRHDQTTGKGIYCVGDAAEGCPELTPVAIRAGRLLVHRLFGKGTETMDYETIPTTVFSPLEYSFVGLSEEAAEQRFGAGSFEVFHSAFTPLEWTVPGHQHNDCYMKMIVRKSDDVVVGFHLLSPNAGEITQGVAVALKAGATRRDFNSTVGIHPTIAEVMCDLDITKSSGEDPAAGGGC